MSTKSPRSRPPKVVWTVTEKATVVIRAADVQQERPELAGLPLLREAMLALPPDRRRRLIAVTQTPWFEPSLVEEVKKRADAAKTMRPGQPITSMNIGHDGDPYVPVLERNADCNAAHVRLMSEWRDSRMQFEADARKAGETILDAILLLHRELVSLREAIRPTAKVPPEGDGEPGKPRQDRRGKGGKTVNES